MRREVQMRIDCVGDEASEVGTCGRSLLDETVGEFDRIVVCAPSADDVVETRMADSPLAIIT